MSYEAMLNDIGDMSITVTTLAGSLLLIVITYCLAKLIYTVCKFFLTVHEYAPEVPHLQQHPNKRLPSIVRRKDGEIIAPDIPPIPNGWFYLLSSIDLAIGQVRHVTLCGMELAVFRDEHGDVHALDAYCPHLGANMAIGGKVKGSCLECPFHAWKFNGADGKCTDIPGAKRIPDIARTKSWPVLEMNLAIMLWYDVEDREPMYVPKVCDEIDQLGWVIHARSEHTVHCHISDIPENGADIGHFIPVHHASFTHGSNLEEVNNIGGESIFEHVWGNATWEASRDEWYLAHGKLRHDVSIFGRKVPFTTFDVTFEQIGPAVVNLRPTILRPLLLMQFAVPLESFKTKLIHLSVGRNSMFGKLESTLLLRGEAVMVERDICLWNHKLYNKPGVLAASPADELIVKFRRWYSQFYSDNSKSKAKEKAIDLSW